MMAHKTTTVEVGEHAERRAQTYLERQGYRLVDRNFHSHQGEIDLIVTKDSLLVFVEVRYRANSDRGTPAETITPRKIRRIIRTAEFFLLRNPQLQISEYRFDVIAIADTLEWIPGAFTLDDYQRSL